MFHLHLAKNAFELPDQTTRKRIGCIKIMDDSQKSPTEIQLRKSSQAYRFHGYLRLSRCRWTSIKATIAIATLRLCLYRLQEKKETSNKN